MKTIVLNALLSASALALLPACVAPANRTVPPQAFVVGATPLAPLSAPAAIHADTEAMTGSYQPVAILYSPHLPSNMSESNAPLFAAKAASLGADAVIGFREKAWRLYPLGLSVRRVADSDTFKLVGGRPLVVEIEPIHWTNEKPWKKARSLKPEQDALCYSEIALALAEKGYFAFAQNNRLNRDDTNQSGSSYAGQIPGLHSDYILRVTVLDQRFSFLVIATQRVYSVRVDLVSETTGAVEQSAVGTGEHATLNAGLSSDPYPEAITRAVSNAIAQMKENR